MVNRSDLPRFGPAVSAGYAATDASATRHANRHWWDQEAADYQHEHRDILGTDQLMWGPEGIYESDLGLLGDLTGLRVLEFGCGAAQGARWCLANGAAQALALDLSAGMLAQAAALDTADAAGPSVTRPVYLQADAGAVPLADSSVDLAFSAYGAVPFVADAATVLTEVARVVRPGGRVVVSLSHPIRWAFPDVPGPEGLTVTNSYFDRTPYLERDAAGRTVYVEHHHTIGDLVRAVAASGLILDDLLEPPWPDGADHTWGGWSPARGRVLPGTAILVTRVGTRRHG